ncbi:hypothetical protein yinte0001_7490 [Yersinia intermedia ATCC 29909]|nr:hypothetical protein yinte0001_7490 [Yersinia intermedia ATCC 29909]
MASGNIFLLKQKRITAFIHSEKQTDEPIKPLCPIANESLIQS